MSKIAESIAVTNFFLIFFSLGLAEGKFAMLKIVNIYFVITVINNLHI